MIEETAVRAMYDEAIDTIKKREDVEEVTVDFIDVKAELTIEILGRVLGIKRKPKKETDAE